MKIFIASVGALLLFSTALTAQLYQGPDTGSVASGAMVSTTVVMEAEGLYNPFPWKPLRNKIPVSELSDETNIVPATGPAGSNIKYDLSLVNNESATDTFEPIYLRSFIGIPMGNSIPPDPYCAVGPTHFISTVNTSFRISDRTGKTIGTYAADTWFNNVFANAGAFDPKISYDHFAKRWIMVWLQQDDVSQTGTFLLSVSDDSIPLGTWYNWALPSSVNGSTPSGGWGDYQGVGFDQDAIYLTTNQFSFAGSYQGSRIRIIPKAQLYANTGGRCQWTDLWNVKDPVNNTQCFGIRPVIVYGQQNYFYFLAHSQYSTGTYVTLFRLSNPLGTPTMTAVNISVTTYYSPPNSAQLGSTTTIDAGSTKAFRFEPIVRGRYLWAVQPVNNYGWSGIKYLRLNLNSNLAEEDYVFGANDYYFSYPAIAVDKDSNIVITYSRSSATDYIGAYFTGKSHNASEFIGSKTLQAGQGTYVVTYGGARNRWGDYMGAWLDPTDESSFWLSTEFSQAPSNIWGVWNAHVRLFPIQGTHLHTYVDTMTFKTTEVGYTSDTLPLTVYSYGSSPLTIDSVSFTNDDFELASSHAFPATLNYRDSANFRIVYKPSATGPVSGYCTVYSNASESPSNIPLKSRGYIIHLAQASVMYGAGTESTTGGLVTINPATGAAAVVGPTGVSTVLGLSISPVSNYLYGILSESTTAKLLVFDTETGECFEKRIIQGSNFRSITFDTNNDLYLCNTSGTICTVDMLTGDTTFIGSSGISNLYGIAINPVTGNMYGLSSAGSFYSINKATGSAALIGATGFSLGRSIAFDNQGKCFGISGSSTNQPFYTINISTGAGTLVGNAGMKGINAIAIFGNSVGIADEVPGTANTFFLSNNYPNPFNPSTSIKYTLGSNANVSLKVFNTLGQEVRTLVSNRPQTTGKQYDVTWDGKDNSGHSVASGIYFYRLEAGSYIKTRKMMLIK